jgi:tetratricopeptide (TPR) repeat protein
MSQQTPEYQNSPAEEKPAPSKAVTRLLVMLAAIMVLGPVIYKEYPDEIARWYYASARELWLDGNREQALEKLSTALTWDPANLDCLVSRANWLIQSEQYEESLAAWNQVIKIRPDSTMLYEQRCTTYLHLQQPTGVLEDWQTIMKLHRADGFPKSYQPSQLFNVYNNRAYHFGVANVQLTKALDDANRAIELLGGNPAVLNRHAFSQYLLAYESYLESQYDDALDPIKKAISLANKTGQSWQQPIEDHGKPSTVAIHRQRNEEFQRFRATLYYLLAEVHKRLGQEKLSQQARQQILELGFTGQFESKSPLLFADSSQPLSEVIQLRTLLGNQNTDPRSMILDTRGFLLWRNNQFQVALWNLDLAVDFARSHHRSQENELQKIKKGAIDTRSVGQHLSLLKKSLAVILYHRALAYESLQQPTEASQDREEIQQLGYQLSHHLF